MSLSVYSPLSLSLSLTLFRNVFPMHNFETISFYLVEKLRKWLLFLITLASNVIIIYIYIYIYIFFFLNSISAQLILMKAFFSLGCLTIKPKPHQEQTRNVQRHSLPKSKVIPSWINGKSLQFPHIQVSVASKFFGSISPNDSTSFESFYLRYPKRIRLDLLGKITLNPQSSLHSSFFVVVILIYLLMNNCGFLFPF